MAAELNDQEAFLMAANINADVVRAQQEEIRRLEGEIARLKRGEFICDRCHLRKDGEVIHGDF